jgi:hypothetical protein
LASISRFNHTETAFNAATYLSKDVHRFARTLRRSQTASADAESLAQYSLRMPFSPWVAHSGLDPAHQLRLTGHKAKMQALIAVARKLLHASYGVLKTETPYNDGKLFPKLQLPTS